MVQTVNFWRKSQKPIIGLAPMDGVSDASFRYITAKYGNPDVSFTEFVSVDGILLGNDRLFTDFIYHESERPVVAQVFGNDPELFYRAALVIAELGFDGLDINMGCPARSVASRGAGAKLITTPKLAGAIISATKLGIEDYSRSAKIDFPAALLQKINDTKETLRNWGGVNFPKTKVRIPVSVKTRIGFDMQVVESWVENLLQAEPANITMHGRTLKQMYLGKADWEAIGKGAAIVTEFNRHRRGEDETITYLGNGDILTREDLLRAVSEYTPDGVLIGRGAFGNPKIFRHLRGEKNLEKFELPPAEVVSERFALIMEHVKLHEALKPPPAFVQIRKHLAWYTKGLHGSAKLRAELMQCDNSLEVAKVLQDYLDAVPEKN